MTAIAALPDRAVLSVSGADRVAFLNGLVSNDVALAMPGRAVWAALLTAQGKWLADFFVFNAGGQLLLDCEAGQAAMLAQRLQHYRLRADVAITRTPHAVWAVWGDAAAATCGDLAGAIAAPDPRLSEAGWRVLTEAAPDRDAGFAAWDAHRLSLGLPDGSRDLEPDRTVLLEAGFDELHGISWTKGCYMGQELTARTRYRGLLKRRLLPVRAHVLPPCGTPVTAGAREVGTVRSSRGDCGLAVLRLDALGGELLASGAALEICIPAWARLPETV